MRAPVETLRLSFAKLPVHFSQVFLPTDDAQRATAKCIMERVAAKLGHDSLTWRTVPTNNKTLGKSAVAVEPHVEQWFLAARGVKDNLETEQQVGPSL